MTPDVSAKPAIPTVIPENIPTILTELARWVVWKAGPSKAGGKFDKIPVDPDTGRPLSATDPRNWLTFSTAIEACRGRRGSGVGIALSRDHPVMFDGKPFIITALDFDHCLDRLPDIKAQWAELGQPYAEVSPSGKGIRMIGLSRLPVRGGNAGQGRELYSTGRFVTITGVSARGTVRDITDQVAALDLKWFGDRRPLPINRSLGPVVTIPETLENVFEVKSMLDCLSPDMPYDGWRDICWSLMSTGWRSARGMAHEWSRKAPHRYDREELDRLLDQFDPARGIKLGTLRFYAVQQGGKATATPKLVTTKRSTLMTAAELRHLPTEKYVVRCIVPARGLVAIYGEPSSGKSFVALDLAHAMATGRELWFGFNVRKTAVAYVALEGQAGFGRRTLAIERHTRVDCPGNLRFWCSDLSLLEDGQIEHLADEIRVTLGTGTIIFIDTLNQASPGADENSSAEMGRIISNAKKLAVAIKGAVILVHHAGKDRSRGLRGHSSLRAALDSIIEVNAGPAGRQWTLTKAKDDQSNIVRDFDLVQYQVGVDEWGELTSCAVQPAIHTPVPKKRPVTGKNQKAALDELQKRLSAGTQGIPYDEARAAVASVLSTDAAHASDRAKVAVDALIRGGNLLYNEGGICLP